MKTSLDVISIPRPPRRGMTPQRRRGTRSRSAARFRTAFTAVALLALGAGCADPPEPLNLLLVTFDTTRADHLGAYGHAGARTPVVDGLAKEGVLFENAYAPVPITLPSHSSLMTGKVPLAHGVRDNGLFVLGEEQLTLAEILRDAGYRTAAAIASFPLTSQFGIGQGFELFDDHVTGDLEDLYGEPSLPKGQLFFDERPAGRVNEAVLPWLDEHAAEPFFLWVHYFDPHHPHTPPPPYDQLFAHEPYDGEIAYADESLGVLLDRLKSLGIRDRTLVVFTADHGEGRGEHGESTHSLLAYNSTLHVPLIVDLPGGPLGRRVPERVSTVDLLPTVLELLRVEPPSELDDGTQGQSLARHFDAEPAPLDSRTRRRLYAETLSPRLTRQWGELRALYYGDFKYIHGPEPELYDLAADPRELDDLVGREPAIARDMERRLADYLAEHAVAELDASVTLDDESLRRLQALGYLQSSGERVGPLQERLSREGDPPQKHASSITAYSQAKSMLFHGQALEARGFLVDLLRQDPDNPYYLELMLTTERRLGRRAAAWALLEELSGLSEETGYPPPEKLELTAGDLLLEEADGEGAYARYRAALELAPSAQGFHKLARIHLSRGERGEERGFLRRALELDGGLTAARLDLGVNLAVSGRVEEAEGEFRRVLEEQPYFARGHYNLATLLVQDGRLDEAADRFERALELRPSYFKAAQALVEIHLLRGRRDEARAMLELLGRRAPGSPELEIARRLWESNPEELSP
ncbi:MAG: sulfatase-like hydrolase/transferase [Acidobacteriota bacterium]